ncbi:MAG: DUF1036 domain-containing protein [Pseudomonadota bacterium]
MQKRTAPARKTTSLRSPADLVLASLCFVGFTLASASLNAAKADLRVCNDTKSMVGVAIGYKNKDDWVTEGWWRIAAEVCSSVIEGDLASRFFYVHAEKQDGSGRWRGPIFMCTSSKEFRIDGLKNCFSRGFEKSGFFEVDTGDQKSWQVRLTEANQTPQDTPSQ